MFPKSQTLDKTNCLASLVGLRTACQPGDKMPPVFIEDIEGIDISKLASLALPSAPSGESLSQQVIGAAAREMMGDIELLLNNGYSLNNIISSKCSSCDLLTTYTANAGIIVKSVSPTQYGKLQITKLTILTNRTGAATFVIDDGETQTPFNINLIAGTKMPVVLQYETAKPSVKIYFTDATIGLGRVSCPTASSCGCGGNGGEVSPVSLSGLLAGNESSVQYGFLPCASVGCSYDALVCSMISQTPNIFGMALLYKVAEKLTVIKSKHERNNELASFEEGAQGTELTRNFGQLYWAKMQGGRDRAGIKTIINKFLSYAKSDKCVTCQTKFYTAGVTG